jgi:hypothetical protein
VTPEARRSPCGSAEPAARWAPWGSNPQPASCWPSWRAPAPGSGKPAASDGRTWTWTWGPPSWAPCRSGAGRWPGAPVPREDQGQLPDGCPARMARVPPAGAEGQRGAERVGRGVLLGPGEPAVHVEHEQARRRPTGCCRVRVGGGAHLPQTAATWLDEDGVSGRQVANQLGHAKRSMTMDHYMSRRAVTERAALVL